MRQHSHKHRQKHSTCTVVAGQGQAVVRGRTCARDRCTGWFLSEQPAIAQRTPCTRLSACIGVSLRLCVWAGTYECSRSPNRNIHIQAESIVHLLFVSLRNETDTIKKNTLNGMPCHGNSHRECRRHDTPQITECLRSVCYNQPITQPTNHSTNQSLMHTHTDLLVTCAIEATAGSLGLLGWGFLGGSEMSARASLYLKRGETSEETK